MYMSFLINCVKLYNILYFHVNNVLRVFLVTGAFLGY